MIILYSSGIAAVAAGHFSMLGHLLSTPNLVRYGTPLPLVTGPRIQSFQDWFKHLPDFERNFFAAIEWLFTNVRESRRQVIPDDQEFERQFDRFEVLMSMIRIELSRKGDYQTDPEQIMGSPGRLMWKFANRTDRDDLYDRLRHDAAVKAGLRQIGLFVKKDSTFEEVVDAFKAFVARLSPRYC